MTKVGRLAGACNITCTGFEASISWYLIPNTQLTWAHMNDLSTRI